MTGLFIYGTSRMCYIPVKQAFTAWQWFLRIFLLMSKWPKWLLHGDTIGWKAPHDLYVTGLTPWPVFWLVGQQYPLGWTRPHWRPGPSLWLRTLILVSWVTDNKPVICVSCTSCALWVPDEIKKIQKAIFLLRCIICLYGMLWLFRPDCTIQNWIDQAFRWSKAVL